LWLLLQNVKGLTFFGTHSIFFTLLFRTDILQIQKIANMITLTGFSNMDIHQNELWVNGLTIFLFIYFSVVTSCACKTTKWIQQHKACITAEFHTGHSHRQAKQGHKSLGGLCSVSTNVLLLQ